MDRRRFLESTAGAAAALVVGSALRGNPAVEGLPAVDDHPPAPPIVELGKTGIKTSRLGQGTGVHAGNGQSDETRRGFGKLVELIHHAYDRGLRFFDLADLYGTHTYFREALTAMDRSQIAILTKLWWRYDGPEEQASLPERRQMARTALERFRQELTTDPDIVLLHCLTGPGWDQLMGPYMDVLSQEKANGRIRAVGCSCDDLGAMNTAASTPWVDVILARINVRGGKDARMDGSREEVESVLQKARKNGKAVIGMKILGEGQLADQLDTCIEYAQGNGLLDAMTIGFHTPAHIDDVLRTMHKFPASPLLQRGL